MTWPFPPIGGPKPWTPEQQRDYERQLRDKIPKAPF